MKVEHNQLFTLSAALAIWSLCATGRAAVPVPLQTPGRPVDVAKLRLDNPAVVSTNGTWRFALTHGEMVDGHFVSQSTSASSSQKPSRLAIDGDAKTNWCASNGDFPQWWEINLGTTESISGIDLAWEFGDGKYKYSVAVGPDDAHLSNVADQTTGKGDGRVEWPAKQGRVLRVTVTDAVGADGSAKWAAIREASITVVREGKALKWTPTTSPTTIPIDDAFAAPGYDDADWHDMPVPSNWEVLGYSQPTYFGPDSAVGLYRRTLDVPASFANKQVLWHFDGVTDSAEVWVNGQRVGYHEGGFTAFDIDLTRAIKPGEQNLLAVRVCKTTPTVDLDTGDYWLLGGIHRESYLLAVPTTHIDDVTVVTKLDQTYKDARLGATVKVLGKPGEAFLLTGTVVGADGKPVDVPPINFGRDIDTDGSATIGMEIPVAAPKLWSAEKPNLYYLMLQLKTGDTIQETVQQRFGFRTVEIKDGVLLWNGVAIKCTGTCRHEEWSALGHALTEHEWQTDVSMMKAANINAVRTSHYNHAERFLELCDEKGLYVLDEIPACWVDPKNEKLKAAFVQHAAETLNRDKNKPCVLAWSCGNESGWGPDFKAMVDYVATTDPTRPRFVSEVSKSQDSALSISDHHYPGDNDLRRIATREAGPSVITEGPHIFYNIPHQAYDYGLNDLWGAALQDQWYRVWPSKGLFGAFIWEWQDQGLADKFADRSKVDANGLRSENSKGIVTGYRVPKPEYYHVKMVYSPVTTDQRDVRTVNDKWVAVFQNRYAFTDLSELACKWQAMRTSAGDEVVAESEIPVACPPGKSTAVAFPVTASVDTLRVAFTNRDGVEIYATRLHVPGGAVPQPSMPLPPGAIRVQDTPASLEFFSNSFSVSIDRKTGQVKLNNGKHATSFGPALNLGEARIDDGDFLNKNDVPWIGSKSPPNLSNVEVSGSKVGENWRGTITGIVSLVEKPDIALGELTCELVAHPDGQIDWNYHLKWTANDMQAWEFGLKLGVAGDDAFSWYRKAQWTEYPAGHIGADRGRVTHADRSFASTKRDTIWAAVTGVDEGIAVLATDGPLHTRCNFKDNVTTLFASSAVSVDRDFSSGFVDNTRILFKQGRTYDGAFRMRLFAAAPAGH